MTSPQPEKKRKACYCEHDPWHCPAHRRNSPVSPSREECPHCGIDLTERPAESNEWHIQALCAASCECGGHENALGKWHAPRCSAVSQEKEPSPSQEEWEITFAREIEHPMLLSENLGAYAPKKIKDFIRQTLSQARASTLKEVGEEIARIPNNPHLNPTYLRELITDILSKLQDKKLP